MGHNISALIAKSPVDYDVAKKYDLPVFEENGFVIVALDVRHSDFWTEKLGLEFGYKSDVMMDCHATHYFARELGFNKFAIIFTDYHGGNGSQSAVAYENGVQILPATEGGINKALRLIGVKRKYFVIDQFDVIKLGQYRSWDDYFQKYED